MSKKSNLMSYGFSLMAGTLLSLTTLGQQKKAADDYGGVYQPVKDPKQTELQKDNTKKKRIDLAPEFKETLTQLFVHDKQRQDLRTETAETSDSLMVINQDDPNNQLPFNTVIVQRLSDYEQVVFYADNADGDEFITEDEVNMMSYFHADPAIVFQRSVVKTNGVDDRKYMSMDLAAKTKDFKNQFNFGIYKNVYEWAPNVKSFITDKHLLDAYDGLYVNKKLKKLDYNK